MSKSSRADYTEMGAIPANVYVVRNPSRAQLRFLYERAASYLCTSRSEGFGWSVADALQYGLPVVSRRVGVLSYPQFEEDPHVHFFVDTEDVPGFINELAPGRVARDMSAFSPNTFRNSLCALLEEAQ
jgi:glycosyltransferase involved in cell wall biosynthesis